ncbi:MAG: hypothetical protein CME26_02885 [Gemmatimonadetes bacterium]|nr:hypothetical protein [Gemmatimonadota bacterium]|tara:strand:+ start:2075 stop:2308 length:234 start_codon:yes stop_codon:yes gene_type:complete
MPNILKRFHAWWMPVAEVVSAFIGRIVLTVFYVVVALPFGLVARWIVNPLGLGRRTGSVWTPMRDGPRSIEEGRRQF